MRTLIVVFILLFTATAFAGPYDVTLDSTYSVKFWATGTVYSADTIVANDGELYTCTVAHTSGTDDGTTDCSSDACEPGTGGSWESVWTQTVNNPDEDKIVEGDSSFEIVDTGTGTATLKVDNTTVWSATVSGVTQGPVVADYDLSDNEYSSQTAFSMLGGESIAVWKLVYRDTTATEMMLADANVASEYPAVGVSVGALDDGATSIDGEEFVIMDKGFGYESDWSWNAGDKLCLSETAGDMIACDDSTICNQDGDIFQWVATASVHDADLVHFDFSKPYYLCQEVNTIDMDDGVKHDTTPKLGETTADVYMGWKFCPYGHKGVVSKVMFKVNHTGSTGQDDYYAEVALLDSSDDITGSVLARSAVVDEVDDVGGTGDYETEFTFTDGWAYDATGANSDKCWAIYLKHVAEDAAATTVGQQDDGTNYVTFFLDTDSGMAYDKVDGSGAWNSSGTNNTTYDQYDTFEGRIYEIVKQVQP